MMQILLTGTAYVVAVFAAGFVLGVLRTLVLVPLLGELAAVLMELPVILTIAFLLLMLAEGGLSTLLAGRSLSEHLALYAQLPHQVGLAGQLAFALLPWIQVRRSQMPPG